MLVAILESKPVLGQREGEVGAEAGKYTLNVVVEDELLKESIAPRALVCSYVAAYLASAVMDTKLPIEMWLVRFQREAVRDFSFPELLDMEIMDDISSLTVQ